MRGYLGVPLPLGWAAASRCAMTNRSAWVCPCLSSSIARTSCVSSCSAIRLAVESAKPLDYDDFCLADDLDRLGH